MKFWFGLVFGLVYEAALFCNLGECRAKYVANFCDDSAGVSVTDAGMVEARKEGSAGGVDGDEGTRNVLQHSIGLTGFFICGDWCAMQVVLLSSAVKCVPSHLRSG